MNWPRKAESLCSRVKSTENVEAFSGIVTSLPPVEGVSETELIVTAKERIDVPGGGVNGTAPNVRLSEASPLVPQFTVHVVPVPLHDASAKTAAIPARAAHTLEFIHVPLTDLGSTGVDRERLEFPHTTLLPRALKVEKKLASCPTIKASPQNDGEEGICYRYCFEL